MKRILCLLPIAMFASCNGRETHQGRKQAAESKDAATAEVQRASDITLNAQPSSSRKKLVISIDQGFASGYLANATAQSEGDQQFQEALAQTIHMLNLLRPAAEPIVLLNASYYENGNLERLLDKFTSAGFRFVLDAISSDSFNGWPGASDEQRHGIGMTLVQLQRLHVRYGDAFAGLRFMEIGSFSVHSRACGLASDPTACQLEERNANARPEPLLNRDFFSPALAESFVVWAKQRGKFILWSDPIWQRDLAGLRWWHLTTPGVQEVAEQFRKEYRRFVDAMVTKYDNIVLTYANNYGAEVFGQGDPAGQWRKYLPSGGAGVAMSAQSWGCFNLAPYYPSELNCPPAFIAHWANAGFLDGAEFVELESFWYFFRWYNPTQTGESGPTRSAFDIVAPHKFVRDAGCLTERGFEVFKAMNMLSGEFEAVLAECRALKLPMARMKIARLQTSPEQVLAATAKIAVDGQALWEQSVLDEGNAATIVKRARLEITSLDTTAADVDYARRYVGTNGWFSYELSLVNSDPWRILEKVRREIGGWSTNATDMEWTREQVRASGWYGMQAQLVAAAGDDGTCAIRKEIGGWGCNEADRSWGVARTALVGWYGFQAELAAAEQGRAICEIRSRIGGWGCSAADKAWGQSVTGASGWHGYEAQLAAAEDGRGICAARLRIGKWGCTSADKAFAIAETARRGWDAYILFLRKAAGPQL